MLSDKGREKDGGGEERKGKEGGRRAGSKQSEQYQRK